MSSTTSIPTPLEDVHGDGRWMSMHRRFISETKDKEPDVVFVGDSIIQHLGQTEYWEKHFEQMHALNFGIGSDTVQNMLWRVQNGELEYINPKVIVLQAGTNNYDSTAEEICSGIESLAKYISEKHPQAFIVVLTLLPRGQKPNPLREKNSEVNRLLPTVLKSIPKTQVVNIDPGFVQADGSINHRDMYDYLHLTPRGYKRAFEPVYDLLLQLLAEN